MEFQLSNFKSWKMMLWKCCTRYVSKTENQPWPQDRKRLVFIPIPKKGNAKECSNYHAIALISHISKEMLILKPSFSNTWTMNFQMFKRVLEKAEEPKIKLPRSVGSSKKQESSRKTSISALLTMPKPLTVWITINSGKFWKRWAYQTTWPASWETCMQVRKQQLELGMEQQTGSKWENEYVKAKYCHPANLTFMQSTSWETLGWGKYKLGSRLPGEISITSDMQITPPLWQKVKKT